MDPRRHVVTWPVIPEAFDAAAGRQQEADSLLLSVFFSHLRSPHLIKTTSKARLQLQFQQRLISLLNCSQVSTFSPADNSWLCCMYICYRCGEIQLKNVGDIRACTYYRKWFDKGLAPWAKIQHFRVNAKQTKKLKGPSLPITNTKIVYTNVGYGSAM